MGQVLARSQRVFNAKPGGASGFQGMGQVLTSIHTSYIVAKIAELHHHAGPRRGLQHRLEDVMIDTLSRPGARNIYVHWGAHESGKSWAAENAAVRMDKAGKFVMLCRGWGFGPGLDLKSWLRVSIGIPDDRAKDKLSTFFPADKQAALIIDHPEYLIKQFGEKGLVDTLDTLGIPVLILVSSWERAVNLKREGCLLLGEPGLGRWTQQELDNLYDTFPERLKRKVETCKPEVRECAVLAGSPGILEFESHDDIKPNMHRARLIGAEWDNGIRALKGEDMTGITGRFPDKDSVFHWDAKYA